MKRLLKLYSRIALSIALAIPTSAFAESPSHSSITHNISAQSGLPSSPSLRFIEDIDPSASLVAQAVAIDGELKLLKASGTGHQEIARLKTIQLLYTELAKKNCLSITGNSSEKRTLSKKDIWIQGISWGILLDGFYNSPYQSQSALGAGAQLEDFGIPSKHKKSMIRFLPEQSQYQSYMASSNQLKKMSLQGLEQTELSRWILDYQFFGKTPSCRESQFPLLCQAFIERTKSLKWKSIQDITTQINKLLKEARHKAQQELTPFIEAHKTIYKNFYRLDKSQTRLEAGKIDEVIPHAVVAFPQHIQILEQIALIPGVQHLAQNKSFAKKLSRILEPKLERECQVDTPQKEKINDGKRVIIPAKYMCWYQKTPSIYYTRDKDYIEEEFVAKSLQDIYEMIKERKHHFEYILHDIDEKKESLDQFLAKDLSSLPAESTHTSRPSRGQIVRNQYRRRKNAFKNHYIELLNQSPHLLGYALLDSPEYIPSLCEDLSLLEGKYNSQINTDNIKNSLLILGLIGLTFVKSPIALAMVVGITGYEVYHYLHEANHEEDNVKQIKAEVLAMNHAGAYLPEHRVDELVERVKELEDEALKFKIYSGLAGVGFINAPVLAGHMLQTRIIGKICHRAKAVCNDVFLFDKSVQELNDIYKLINSHSKTRHLLAKLSKKYNADPEDIVLLINSKFSTRANQQIDEVEHHLEHASHFLAHDLHHLNKAPEYAHLAERAISGTVKYLLPTIKYARFARTSRVALNSGLQLERSREFAELYNEVFKIKEYELKNLEPGQIFSE